MGSEAPILRFRGPFGVPVEVGGSLLLLVLLFVVTGGLDPALLVYDACFVAILVVSILLHELGHAWGCRVQGIPVRRIVIHGGGGFCEQERGATARQQELIVAMGPIVNLAIWALTSLALPYSGGGMLTWFLYWTATINIFLALFNLLPVHPLDGGKLFHLALLRILPASTATRISGGVGLVFAVLWIPAAIWLFLAVGLVLFFFPPIGLHLQMLRLNR